MNDTNNNDNKTDNSTRSSGKALQDGVKTKTQKLGPVLFTRGGEGAARGGDRLDIYIWAGWWV